MPCTTQEVVTLRRALEKATKADDIARVKDVLSELLELPITVDALAESKVGSAVSKLKKHAEAEVVAQAKQVIKKWKRVAEEAGVTKATKKVDESTSEVKKSVSVSKAAAKEKEAAPKAAEPPKKLSADAVNGLGEPGLLPARLRVRQKFLELLSKGEGESTEALQSKAKEMEDAVNAHLPLATKKDDYMSKVRQLSFNMKKNDEMRQQVLSGELPCEQLPVLSAADMLPKAKKAAMDKEASDLTEARRLDWREKNRTMLNKQAGITNQVGMFECHRCKSRRTDFFQQQTRSADEPMTVFVTCEACGYKWRF